MDNVDNLVDFIVTNVRIFVEILWDDKEGEYFNETLYVK